MEGGRDPARLRLKRWRLETRVRVQATPRQEQKGAREEFQLLRWREDLQVIIILRINPYNFAKS